MRWCCRSMRSHRSRRSTAGLPMKKGRAGTMTHDYKRHGTTTLFAALNVLDGTVIGQNMQRHRHQEFIRFLNRIERTVPGGQGHPRDRRQLRGAQQGQGPRLARPPSALDFPLHTDLLLVAQCRRGLLRKTHPAAAQARRLPFRRRSPGRNQPLRPRIQCGQPTAIHMESRPRRHHRSPKPRVPNVGINPLDPKGRSLSPLPALP